MRYSIIHLILGTILILLIKCANPITPDGGPRDTIPPTLLNSFPENQQINFSSNTITLEFDEFINTDKLKTNLLITPTIDNSYKVLTKRNSTTLKFEDAFPDSTTYTLNFFDGITDITEKNPAENIIISFSTGTYIDSLSISGRLLDNLTNTEEEDFIVGLYALSDTLDFSKEKPKYFISTTETGEFKLLNLKSDAYRLVGFKDENRNLLFDYATEKFSFLTDTLALDSVNIDSLVLYSNLIDISPLKLNISRTQGIRHQIRYSKTIYDYDIMSLEDHIFTSIINEDNESINIYSDPTNSKVDSTGFIVTVYDTLRYSLVDTLYAKFEPDKEIKLKEFQTTAKPNRLTVQKNFQFQIKFNLPVLSDSLILTVKQDSLYNLKLRTDSSSISWNKDHSTLDINIPWDWSLYSSDIDSIYTANTPDSLHSTKILESLQSNALLIIPKGQFVSIHQDTLETLEIPFKKLELGEVGEISYTITNPPTTDYLIQLIDNNSNTIQQKNSTSTSTFSRVLPGKYGIRIIMDLDSNGIWSPPNFFKNIPPEPSYIHEETTELRANWEQSFEAITIPYHVNK